MLVRLSQTQSQRRRKEGKESGVEVEAPFPPLWFGRLLLHPQGQFEGRGERKRVEPFSFLFSPPPFSFAISWVFVGRRPWPCVQTARRPVEKEERERGEKKDAFGRKQRSKCGRKVIKWLWKKKKKKKVVGFLPDGPNECR